MNLNRVAGAMNRIAHTFIIVNVAFSALLLSAYGAGWRPVHSVAETSNAARVLNAQNDSAPIGADAVIRAIRGKAIFRTFRVVEDKAVDELGSRYTYSGALRNGDNSKVFIKDTKEKKTLILDQGDTFGGRYIIEEIRADGVRINHGGETVFLKR